MRDAEYSPQATMFEPIWKGRIPMFSPYVEPTTDTESTSEEFELDIRIQESVAPSQDDPEFRTTLQVVCDTITLGVHRCC